MKVKTLAFNAILLTVSAATLIWFLTDLKHVADVQHDAEHPKTNIEQVSDLFGKCRDKNLIPVAKPDFYLTEMKDNVDQVYCMEHDKYYEFKFYSPTDEGDPFRLDKDVVVKVLKDNVAWGTKHPNMYLTGELDTTLPEKVEKYYDYYDQQAVDEQKVKNGEMEASRAY